MHLPNQQKTGELFGHRQFQVRIVFVIFKQNVIPGLVCFYQIIFKKKRFTFCGGDDQIDGVNLRDHCRYSGGMPGRFTKIGADTAGKVYGLADIEDFAVFVFHLIDSRPRWQSFECFLKMRKSVWHLCDLIKFVNDPLSAYCYKT